MFTSQNCCSTTNIEIAINIGVGSYFQVLRENPCRLQAPKRLAKSGEWMYISVKLILIIKFTEVV